ncbi:hypothetical protein [Vibrio campbellii]|uniref:hypothetical protein n=2 Tax=Vibrio campbellii TaxID=680 RepID=UPI0005EEE9B3|nr:hypothetical protein [Vibrio campbellii]UMM04473.1 hypothetical protein MKR81_07755 [Vibrio campbellii]
MKNKLLLLALLSTNTCFANEIFFFEQVTAYKLSSNQHSLSGVEKHTNQRIRIEWQESPYSKPERINRCINAFQQAMSQPERYYLNVELSELLLIGCEIGIKERFISNEMISE